MKGNKKERKKERKRERRKERKKERKKGTEKEKRKKEKRKKEERKKKERKRLLSFALVLFTKGSDIEQYAVVNASKEPALKDPDTTLCCREFEYT